MSKRTTVENLGEALSVFIQTAEVAQKSGILSFDDAVVVKSAIDFVMTLNNPAPQDEVMPVVKSMPEEKSEVESA
jgi:hypothetical protein